MAMEPTFPSSKFEVNYQMEKSSQNSFLLNTEAFIKRKYCNLIFLLVQN